MAASTHDASSAVQRLAEALLDDVERIAPRSVARMQELLPSYGKVPADALIPVTLTNTRNLLEAVRDPDMVHSRDDDHFRVSGATRLGQGITADEMLQAWRIGLEVVREEAHRVAKRLEVTDAELLKFVEATLLWGDIGMRRSAAAYREGEIRELERLAAEQAALRRVAMLVARECSPKEVFAKVAEELSRLLGVDMVRMLRFEPDGTVTLEAAREMSEELLPVGLNVPIPRGGVVDRIFRTGEPARVDDTGQVEGPIGESLRREGLRWAAGGPIVVDERLWGAMVVGSSTPEGSSETERRVAEFAELVSTAISSVESRERVERLAAEQAALRRVATLVAEGTSLEALCATVCEEVGRLLEVPSASLERYDADEHTTTMATWGRLDGWIKAGLVVGARWPLDGPSISRLVLDTGRPAAITDYSELPGTVAAMVRAAAPHASVAGVPITVEGKTWGVIAVSTTADSTAELPLDVDSRLARFTDLISTAVANSQARDSLRALADEQAALRRVAELVARQAPPEQVFALVTEELGRLVEVNIVRTVRFEPDGTATIVASHGVPDDRLTQGTNIPIPKGSTLETVFRTGRPARTDDFAVVQGPIGTILRDQGAGAGVGGPIVVEGRLWGAMLVGVRSAQALPPGSEDHVAQFAELVSTAISNIESRAKVERLAAEQSALRRVAELVAREHSPEDLFATLVEELGMLLEVDATAILRYEADSTATVVAGWSDGTITLPVGDRFVLEGENLAGEVHRTGLPGRKTDYGGASGVIAATVRGLGIRSAVASPIVVEGATWGVLAVLSRQSDGLPSDTEARIAEFTRQAALAVANAKSRSDLAESRARIVRAGDEARRRFERNLHDGAQQRLVSLGLELRAAEASMPPAPDPGDLPGQLHRLGTGLNDVLDDLRELSRGLHPAVLSEGGLGAALSSLARRSAVPVDLRLDLGADRFEEPVEVTAYYVASEALTNIAKHAQASRAAVRARQRNGWLEVIVSDDGRGGADASSGSGLTGLIDRVEAIAGTIRIDSRKGLGTTLRVKLPIESTRS